MADWSKLPADLLHLISQRLPTSTDCRSFSSVCPTWRAAARHPPPAAPCFSVLPGYGIDTCCGYYLSNRTVHSLQPLLSSHSSRIMKWCWGYRIRMELIYPIQRNKFKYFPSACPRTSSLKDISVSELGNEYLLEYTSSPRKVNSYGERMELYKEKVAVLNNKGGGFVVLAIHVTRSLMVYKSRDEEWRFVDFSCRYDDIILWEGSFYAVNEMGTIVLVNTDDLNVRVVANVSTDGNWKVLVGSGGELLLVDVYCFCWNREFDLDNIFQIEVYELDIKKEKWRNVIDLEGKIVFLSFNCAFLVSVEAAYYENYCLGDCILLAKEKYYDDVLHCYCVGVYDLHTGHMGPIDGRTRCSQRFGVPPDWVSLLLP